jgi:hypothetical protein
MRHTVKQAIIGRFDNNQSRDGKHNAPVSNGVLSNLDYFLLIDSITWSKNEEINSKVSISELPFSRRGTYGTQLGKLEKLKLEGVKESNAMKGARQACELEANVRKVKNDDGVGILHIIIS